MSTSFLSPSPRTAGPVGLVAGAAAFGVGDLLRRSVDTGAGSPNAIVAAVQQHPITWLAAGALSVLATVLMLPAVLSLPDRAMGRGRVPVAVGSALFGLGLIASVGHAVAYFGSYAALARAGLDAAQVSAVATATENTPFLIGFILLFVLGLMLGQLVLWFGLWRARLVPVWALLAALVDVVAGNSPGMAAGVVGLIGWVAATAALLRRRSVPGAVATAPLAVDPARA
ncbi:hypothetical protein [Phycicoccus duodecadis]|uniref:DUF4386 family protein n=1 Tax=Phycicoccus duodecadis TaxID=173053 RepID=A0A2N3YLR8_9MICO|nr:hypothetical protein [Phycicoccus duodecadis]PKW27782.1 hypothetical protein ATL31_2633 [Phycicoccus duodecadis]